MDWRENSKAEAECLVQALDLGAEDCALDICCGYGRHAIPLASTSIGRREMRATCRSARALANFSIRSIPGAKACLSSSTGCITGMQQRALSE